MAIISDLDDLNSGTSVVIDATAKTIKLTAGAGNLTTEGVTGLCLYSFLKSIWKTNNTLIAYPFPMQSITSEQFEFINGWLPADDATRKLIRTAGWTEYNTAGSAGRKYAGIITLGALGTSDQVYYQLSTQTAVDFTYAGAVNEAIQIMGDATVDTTTTTFDYSSALKVLVRIQGKTYAQSVLSDIGVSSMTNQVYRFPLTNSTDQKITISDATISTDTTLQGVIVTYYSTPQTKTIGSSQYTFNTVITGNGATAQQIYNKIQYLLRQTVDIDSGEGTVLGNTADELLSYTGDTLYTKTGVFIEGFASADTNNIVFVDTTGAQRTYPYTASLTLNFNTYLANDADAIFRVYFTNDSAATTPAGHNYGTANAITVQDASATPVNMAGSINGRSTVSYTYDYDGNVQRGAGSSAKDAPITVVAIGLSTGQYVSATGTIGRSTTNTVSLVAAQERNYYNP